ncbi:Gfo/Idh/MocA family oxidoreductase [Rubellicoccus peritrichatus]|uniref:Gfo/Idh/MocA family oxidoreductase n=1 Tax=Rubellicoccus peritrichatus TaxID=3080537 RepID=A0AAQ3QSA3_9BACT|nr:Gfo/Idh/MocA family oxidoreductase [Puniceicoccus sp. CR14]WOO42188.1 Gfo/Idh/MocA family oxidoreductase [Puniceicoccus sp. CR14]
MDKIRYGLIGAGQIAYSASKQINDCPASEAYGATDFNAERLQKLCTEREIPNSYETTEALLADKNIDAVYIAVPNKFHASLAIQALEAGKHVILEKPFAMNAAEAQEVATAAEKSGKLFTLGMNQRFTEKHQKIVALAREGIFGEIYHAKAFWNRRAGIPSIGTWFGKKELAGGGCLNDIGVHFLDLCLYALNRFDAVSVYGATYTKFGNRGLGDGNWGISDKTETVFDVEDFASAIIRFEDGLTVTLDASWACHQETSSREGVHLFGTEAGADVAAAKVFRDDPIREDYDVIDNVKAEIKYPHCSRFDNLTNAILGKEELCVTLPQAIAVQKILDAIQQSSISGHEVFIDQDAPSSSAQETSSQILNPVNP